MVKKRRNYDFSFNYMEEVYFPNIIQRWWLLHTDPVWYRFILFGIVAEALIIYYINPFQMKLFATFHNFFINVQFIFNIMYIVDIILTFRQKFFFKFRYPYPNPIRRPAPVMVMEIASVVPFELIFIGKQFLNEHLSNDGRRLYMGLITLRTLKIPRFFYHMYNNRRDLYNEFNTRLIEMVVILMVFSGFAVHVLHLFNVVKSHHDIYKAFQLIAASVIGRGGAERIAGLNVYQFEIAVSVFAICMWTFVIYPTTSLMILSFIENQQHRYDYSRLVKLFKTKISAKYNLPVDKSKMMTDYFEANWKLRGGFRRTQFDFAQKSLEIEIAMDTCWPAFKHSMLFRKSEFYILRALANKFERRILMEGEYIFEKGKIKLGLIYIVQGVIEVLSAENDESGILLLTAGTCVGEAALIIPHYSSVNFRCKTICEVFELNRDNFMVFQKSYHTEYKQLQLRLKEVLTKVRKLTEHNAKFNQLDINRKRLIWIKYQLHNLMADRASYKNIHEQTNIYLREELENCVRKQGHLLHTYEYLDKLAIRERTYTDTDIVFIRNTCPWILKAGSPITKLWEYIIVLLTIVCALVVSYGFCIEYNGTIVLILSAIHAVFAFDIVVQIITPVYTDTDARTLSAVLNERLRTKGFFLDILSVYYWHIIAFLFDTNLPWFELFKLVKLWRVWQFFVDWNNRFLTNIVLFTIVLGGTVYVGLIYFLSCIFVLNNITDSIVSAVTIQYATGTGMPFPISANAPENSFMLIFAYGLSLIIQLAVTAMICGSFYLHYLAKWQIVTTITSLEKWVSYKNNNWLWIRLHAYFNVVQHDKDVRLSQGNISRVFDLPRYFESIMKSKAHFDALKRLQIMQNLPDEVISMLLVATEVFTCYRHSIIISRGIIYKDVFVLIQGECRTLICGTYHQTKTYEPMNFLENCYNSPAVTSTVALTDCLILKFNYEKFLHFVYEKSMLNFNAFKETVQITKEANQEVMMKLLYDPIMVVSSRIRRPNIKRFRYFSPKNSYDEFDYHVPFDKIRPFHFIKFLLMRTTFYPEGRILICYEICRCMVAFTSACVFTIPALNVGAYTTRSAGYQIMLALDLFAVVDIYIRMHVMYYNTHGILVSHPLKTATNYMTHGFFIDFLAVFPFDIFPMKVQYRVVLNAMHALEMYRIGALRRYFTINSKYYILNTITVVSYMLFVANFITGLIFVYDCYSWESEVQVPIANCTTFMFGRTEAHFYILFLVMSSLQCSGMTGMINVADLDSLLTLSISLLAISGAMIQIIYKAYTFSSYINKLIDKYNFVVGVRRLLRLLAQDKDSWFLRKEVCNFYDLHWARVASKNMARITQDMISALKRDMLFKFYGPNLVTYSIFTENIIDTTLFMKNIFLAARPMVIPKNGYVITINDVDRYIYFINHGSVDALAVDSSKMIELTAGAIFGNFTADNYTRMKLSIVANVNTELVYVSSEDFNKIISYFPKIYERFQLFVKRNVYYIESTKPIEPKLRMTYEEYIRAVNKYSVFQIINYAHLVYVCYLGFFLELYQIAVGEMHHVYLAVQYSMDLLHLVKEYLKYKLPYKDEHRAPIFEHKSIVARQVENRTEQYVMIITVIYIDVFFMLSYIFLGRFAIADYTYWITVARLNRLLRVYYIYAEYRRKQEQISMVSGNMTKWLYVLYWYISSYLFIATVTCALDTLTTGEMGNLMRNIDVEKLKNIRSLPPLEKFNIFARYFYFSNIIHINSNSQFIGPTNVGFIIYVIVLYMYRLVIDSILACGFYEAIVDIAALRRIYLKGASFLRFYKKSFGTSIIKDRVVENAYHGWTKNYYKSEYIMNVVCARYLKEVIMDNLYGYLLKKHPVFGHTHIDFLRQLGIRLKKVIYPCNFVIVYRKEMRKCMFFVHKGSVACYDVDFGYPEIALTILNKGESFGFLQGLGQGDLYDYTYITTGHTEVIELEWDSWNYLLHYFPASKEYLFEEREKYKNVTSLQLLQAEMKKKYW